MLHDEPATVAYFKHLDLVLGSSQRQRGGKVLTVWHLHAGSRLWRINNKTNFASLEALWREWHAAQIVYEHLYAQAIIFAEDSVRWSGDQRRMMDCWFRQPWTVQRASRGLYRDIYTMRINRDRWPWSVLQIKDARHAVQALGPPWNTPCPAPLAATSLTAAELEDPTWRARALVTARFDMQAPALFVPALQRLLRNAEQAVLDARLQQAAVGAPVLVRRRL